MRRTSSPSPSLAGLGETPSGSCNQWPIEVPQQPAGQHSAALFECHAGPRVVHEEEARRPVAFDRCSELQAAQVFHRLVAIVGWRDQSERGTVVHGQALAIHSIGDQYSRREEILEQHPGSSTILPFEPNQCGTRVRLGPWRHDLLEKVRELHPFPLNRPITPGGDAMKVRDLFGPGQSPQRVLEPDLTTNPANDLEGARPGILGESLGKRRQAEPIESHGLPLTPGQRVEGRLGCRAQRSSPAMNR